ncbi:hypothetical protein BGZ76_011483 [Entomortierella beljakovae]|nr:hypothetical protein BGZ76_011483 [Entomortierella beljakovae]
MPSISGYITASFHGASVGPNCRLTVQLLDVSLLDAPSVTLSEQTFVTGPFQSLPFPIRYTLKYDKHRIQPSQSIAVSARAVDISSPEENLIWISTSRNSVITQGNPSENVDFEVQAISTEPEPSLDTVTGTVVPSQKTAESDRKIKPNSKVAIQLLDVSLMDAPSVTLAEQTFITGPEARFFPIEFSLQYDPKRIDTNGTYSVCARVNDANTNTLVWTSTSNHRVLSSGGSKYGVTVDLDLLQ